MSEEVAVRVRRAIEEHGPITFAEFMELALYGPGGFYERPPVGRHGHFVTSPHVHPVFGELVGRGLREMWVSLGRTRPFLLIEVGAGDGTLARQLLEHLVDVPLDYIAVERSPGARTRLGELPIVVAERLDDLGQIEGGCVVANELIDNLPFHRVRRTAAGLAEIGVGLDGDVFAEVEVPCDPELVAAAPPLERDEEAAVSLEALRFVDGLSSALRKGYAVLMDYGATTGAPAGEVHGYRRHRVVESVLEDPGSADITAGVDFAALSARGRDRDLEPFGPTTQRDALIALGFDQWNEEQRARQASLLSEGAGGDAVRVWGGRSRASLLVDPAGLGRLGWLVLATAGLPQPPWLERALADSRPSPD